MQYLFLYIETELILAIAMFQNKFIPLYNIFLDWTILQNMIAPNLYYLLSHLLTPYQLTCTLCIP